MQISEFTFRLIIIFLPGVIAYKIIDWLTVHKVRKVHDQVIYSLLIGIICYTICGLFSARFNIFKMCLDPQTGSSNLNIGILAWPTLVAIIMGLGLTKLIERKWFHRKAHSDGLTNKIGDIDIRSYILNSTELSSQWVVVRDLEHDLMYWGIIEAFSDVNTPDELLLSDVTVFKNSTGQEMYKVANIYLAYKRESIVLEFFGSSKGNAKENSPKEEMANVQGQKADSRKCDNAKGRN